MDRRSLLRVAGLNRHGRSLSRDTTRTCGGPLEERPSVVRYSEGCVSTGVACARARKQAGGQQVMDYTSQRQALRYRPGPLGPSRNVQYPSSNRQPRLQL